MSVRATDSSTSTNSIARINTQRARLGALQERLSTNKRINRASDDPNGAGAVITLRTTQTEIEQFKRSASTANDKLVSADTSLNDYENVLTRVKTLVSQGLSDTTSQTSRDALATEIDSLRNRVLGIANTKNGDEYLFGGTRQNAAPFDPTTAAPATTPASAQYVQIEPGAPAIAVGVTAETVFSDATSDIFKDLNNAVAALKGTGNAAADKATLQNTMNRLGTYASMSDVAHVRVGVNMNVAESTIERLTDNALSVDARASSIEDADFAETALQFTAAQQGLDATLQATVQGRRSLFDFLG